MCQIWCKQLENKVILAKLDRINLEYCEITFIRRVLIFVVFMGMLIQEIKNPTNNESWESI